MRPAALAMVLLAAAGCGKLMHVGGGPGSPPAPTDRVDAVVAEAAPMALNWDEKPGPDGIRVRVNLFRSDAPQPLVGEGSLDFLIYLGKAGDVDPSKTQPFHTWSYTAPELKAFLSRNIVGWAYSLALGWGDHVPPSPTIMLLVRYRPLIGDAVYSKPICIIVSEK